MHVPDESVMSAESESLVASESNCAAVEGSERHVLLSISHHQPAASSSGVATLALQSGRKVLVVRASIVRAVVAGMAVGALLLLLLPRLYNYAAQTSFDSSSPSPSFPSSSLLRSAYSFFLPSSAAESDNSTDTATITESPLPLAWPLPLPRLSPASYDCSSERLCPAAYDMLYTVDPFYYAPPLSADNTSDIVGASIDANTLANSTLRVSPVPPPGWQRNANVTALPSSPAPELSAYPAALFDEVQVASADKAPSSAEQSHAHLLLLCRGNESAAQLWWTVAVSARQALVTAPASTPAALFVEGRTDTDALYAMRLLMLLDNAVHSLPSSQCTHTLSSLPAPP